MNTNRHPIEQEELMAYLDGELPISGVFPKNYWLGKLSHQN